MNSDKTFASNVGCGFIELRDATPHNGSHFIRASSITAIRPAWDKDDVWIGCDVYTVDGSQRRVNASVEQILAAAMDADGSAAQSG